MEDRQTETNQGAKREGIPDDDSSANPSKRPKNEEHDTSQPTLSDAALLYHFAYTTWQSANRYLTQSFIPSSIHPAGEGIPQIRLVDPNSPTHVKAYTQDARAGEKALSLQILALDTLKIGLKQSSLSDQERVAFGVLFGKIGVQVVQGLGTYRSRKGKEREYAQSILAMDCQAILHDVEEQISTSMALARKSAYLLLLCHQLELLNIRILLIQGKTSIAKRSVKQYAEAAHLYPAHLYSLQLLLLEEEHVLGPEGSLAALSDVLKYAKHCGHQQMIQILLLARTRLLCHQRRWDLLSEVLDELGSTLGWTGPTGPESAENQTPLTESSGFSWTLAQCKNAQWLAPIAVQFLLYQCLWQGRQGRPNRVKALRKEAFGIMDQASECHAFDALRENGGLLDVAIAHNGQTSYLTVQTTPPNMLYILTYYIALVSHHDISGRQAKAKALVYSNAMRQTEDVARADDMWDTRFSLHHGVHDALTLQHQVIMVRAGVMLEQAFALIYRSAFVEADRLLDETVNILRDHDLFSHLAIHILLLRAQSAHLLGQENAAVRHYRAGLANLVPGSELGLVFQIGLLGASGQLEDISHETESQIKEIGERARVSTNSMLVGYGHFLSSLLDTGAQHKTKLRHAFGETTKNADKLLYVLLFAFLASVDVSGEFERVEKQLGAGKDLAKGMGGMDRKDGVGQGSLGVWFARKLSRMYKRAGHPLYGPLSRSVEHHAQRNKELLTFGIARYNKEGQ